MTEQEFLQDLTKEQREAILKFDSDVTVTANAGSGKTTMLVRKYIYLQLFHPATFNYKNIVAITFTNKASAEILAKIRETIVDLLDLKSNIPADKRKFLNIKITDEQRLILTEINKNLVNLEVGTIHQFCRKLIKNFAFRINLQPNFTSFDEGEKSLLIRKLIIDVLSSYDTDISKYSRKVTSFLGFEKSIELIQSLIYKNNYFAAHSEFYEKDVADITNIIEKKFKEIHKSQILNLIHNNKNSKLEKLNKFKPEKVKPYLDALNGFVTESEYDEKSLSDIGKAMSKLRTFKNGNSIILKEYIGANNDGYWKSTSDFFLSFSERVESESKLLANRVEIGLSLTKIADEVYKRYDALNTKANRIDNDSTIDLTVRLLQDKVVQDIVQFDLAYLMIDEFQDTDDRQLKIADLIREGGKVKLFVVGDDKQGIYKFRNADVRVFKKLRESLPKSNQLELNTSFRSNVEINAFTNTLFAPFMSSSKSEYDVDYQSMISANNDQSSDLKRVNVMLYGKNGEEEVGSIEQVFKSLDYLINKNKVEPNDICILCYGAPGLIDIIDVLSDKGLEYVLMSGKGFYQKNEVKELIAFLQFIDNPDNDLLCAATLKSSLFGYIDKDLLEISIPKESNTTLWERFQTYAKKSNDENHIRVASILTDYIDLSNKLPISNILIKIIDESNWNYYYHNDKRQVNVYRNLYKFMSLIRSMEDREFNSLAHTFDLLDDSFKFDKESEDVGDSSKAIKLSTIHNAKGLEFPHVIIYKFDMFDINSSGERRTIDEKFGSYLKMPSSLDEYADFAKKESLIDLLIAEDSKISDAAENLRKYYVAVTRASESVHLIMKHTKDGKQMSQLENVLEGIKTESEIRITSNIKKYDKEIKNVDDSIVSFSIHIDFNKSELDDYSFNLAKNEDDETRKIVEYLGEIPAFEKVISFNATKLSMFERGERDKFEEIYIFGMPKLDKLKFIDDDITEEIVTNKTSDGTEYGVFFHSLMENIDTIADNTFEINNDNFANILGKTAEEYRISINDETKSKLKVDLKTVLNSEFISNNKEVLFDSFKEYDLKMSYGDHILKAIFDAIHVEGETAEVWDWKTNKFNEYDTLEKKAATYNLQMDMYAFFAFHYDTEITRVNTRLLFIQKANSAKSNEDWIYTKTYTRKDIATIYNKIADLISGINKSYPNTYSVSTVEHI